MAKFPLNYWFKKGLLVIIALALLVFVGNAVAADSTNPSPDFDGDGTVGVSDFLEFVNHFGTSRGDAGYDAKYDLDGNGEIGTPDFLIFVDSFGSEVPLSGGGGGGSSSPDLIIESPSVSNNTLMTGQSFTLSATIRNSGNGQSAATILRYYRSSDATISTSDTEVGTNSVNRLVGSGTSAESISLNAPSYAGTYYYGACVESVSGESNTDNNCSDGVHITVSSGGSGSGGGGEGGEDGEGSGSGGGGEDGEGSGSGGGGEGGEDGEGSGSGGGGEDGEGSGSGGGGEDGEGSGSGGACTAGLVVNPGESCTWRGNTFSVFSSGRGSIAGIGSDIGLHIVTVQGESEWDFYALKNSGSNSWTVHTAE